jgi:hypothetical protein
LITQHVLYQTVSFILYDSEISQGQYAFSGLLFEYSAVLATYYALNQNLLDVELFLVPFEVGYHEVESSVE